MDDYLREILARQEAGQDEFPEPEEALLKISPSAVRMGVSGETEMTATHREIPRTETPMSEMPETEPERSERLWEMEEVLGRQSMGQRYIPELREEPESRTASGPEWPEVRSPERETAVWGKPMDPEALSMYFQRDARRYS